LRASFISVSLPRQYSAFPSSETGPWTRRKIGEEERTWLEQESHAQTKDQVARFREKCSDKYGKSFAELSPAQKTEYLNEPGKVSEEDRPAAQFFGKIHGLTIRAYYASPQGWIEELGYKGNTYVSEFKGCTHPEHQAWWERWKSRSRCSDRWLLSLVAGLRAGCAKARREIRWVVDKEGLESGNDPLVKPPHPHHSFILSKASSKARFGTRCFPMETSPGAQERHLLTGSLNLPTCAGIAARPENPPLRAASGAEIFHVSAIKWSLFHFFRQVGGVAHRQRKNGERRIRDSAGAMQWPIGQRQVRNVMAPPPPIGDEFPGIVTHPASPLLMDLAAGNRGW
jgi:Gluconate 2-dehydrogenase subunit 3